MDTILIPLSAPIRTADDLHRAIDRLCYRVGARVSDDGQVTFQADREQCGDLRELRNESPQPVRGLTGKMVLLTAEVLECPSGDYVLVRVVGASGPSRGVLPVLLDQLRLIEESPQPPPTPTDQG